METYQKWYRRIVHAGVLSLLVIFLSLGVAGAEENEVSNTSDVFPGSVQLVTQSADGNGVYANHAAQSMSEDGSFVFTSNAKNLVTPPTTGGEERFYFFDNVAKTVSVLPSFGTDGFLNAQITPDKQWIVLSTFDYTLKINKLFLYSTVTAELTAVTKADGTTINGGASTLTADGSIVAITTLQQLTPADTNTKYDLYLWHRSTKEVQLTTTNSNNTAIGIERGASGMSDDGNLITYMGSGSNFPACGNRTDDVYRKNIATGEVICVTQGIDDSDGEYFNNPQMSADGSVFLVNGLVTVGLNPQMIATYLVNLNNGTTPTLLFNQSELNALKFFRLTADGKQVIYSNGVYTDPNNLRKFCTYEIAAASHSCVTRPDGTQDGNMTAISPTGRFSVIWSWDHSWIGSTADTIAPITQNRYAELFIWDRNGVNNAISGKVTGDDGTTGLEDVTLNNGTRERYVTNANGQYTIPYLNAGQSYEITPSLSGKTFYPASKQVAAPSGNVDFSTKNPVQSVVVFIPGVNGSTQLSENKVDLWPGLSTLAGLLFGDTYKRLSLESGVAESGVIAGDAIRVASLPFGFESIPVVRNLVDSTIVYKPFLDYLVNELGYREYLVENDPNRRKASEGCQDKEQASFQPTLFVFAYDWRQSITENSALLGDYIGCVHKFYPGIKVTLIGHSMGGLLARKYIVSGGESNVKTLITINTPWLGAPKVLRTMIDGTWQAPYSPSILKQLVKYFPGAYQLIPSERYLSSVSLPPFREGGIDLDKDGKLDEQYQNLSDYDGFFNALAYTTMPYSVNSAFFDNLFLDPTAGRSVQHFSLITQQEGNTTPGQIFNLSTTVCNSGPSGEYSCNNLSFYTDHAVTGDGTVPLDSLQGLLKAQIGNTTRFFSPGLGSDHSYSHKEAMSNNKILAAITSILSGSSEVLAASVGTEGDHISRYIRLYGVEALTITHPISGSISSTDHTLDFFSFPGVLVSQEGENGYVITMAPDATYDITYKGSKPVFLQTAISDGGSNIRVSQSFNNQPQTQSGELTLHVSASTEVSLTYQTNLGSLEVQPTGTYTDASPIDQIAPVVTIKQTSGGQVEVVAEDENAITMIYVSKDGNLYTAYTQPFAATAGTVVTSFADDSVGNRSNLVSYTVHASGNTQHIYLPLVQR
jgi:pimeloyl-ACP methyl ester carboxylesterase